MKKMRCFLLFVTAMAAASPSFARQTVTVDPTQLSTDGGLNGADITGAHTLLVGVGGGPELDIYTNNPAPFIGVTAVGSPTDNDQGMVQFNVDSTVDGDMGATTTHVLHMITVQNATTVNFQGSVYSTTMNVGAANVNFNGGATATNTVAPNFTGDGTIGLAANTTVTGALITATDNTGTLALGSGSQWTGSVGTGPSMLKSVNVAGGSNVAGVSAGVTGSVNVHAVSLLTNTLNINGAWTLANNGSINTTLASPTVYGHIIPSGGPATIGTGVNIDAAVPSGAYIPVGTKFQIVQPQNGGTLGAGLTVTDSTNPLYKFSYVATTPGDIEINTDDTPVQSAPTAPGGPPVPGLPALLGTPVTPDLAIVLAAINALSDPNAVANAVVQLGPSASSLESPLVTFQGAREFQNLWLSRLTMCSQTSQPDQAMSNCQGSAPSSGWWIDGFGYFGKQNDRNNTEGYDAKIGGTMLAYDVALGLNTRAGLGFGYAHSSIDGNTFDANTSFDSYQPTAYIGHDAGPMFVHGSASFGWNSYSSIRPIVFPGIDRTANANYSGQDYTALANTGYHFAIPQKFTITPLASLQYSRVHINNYTESGAGDIDLSVASQNYNFLESGLGAKAERDFSYRGWALVPELHAEWLHELLDPTLEQTEVFTAPGSPSFNSQAINTDRNTYHVGTGLSVLSCTCSATKLSVEAGYDYFWTTQGYSAHQVTARLTERF